MQRERTDSFGGVIKSAREHMGMTQLQLADNLRISSRYLKALESGGREPSYGLFVRMFSELGVQAYAVTHYVISESCNHTNSTKLV